MAYIQNTKEYKGFADFIKILSDSFIWEFGYLPADSLFDEGYQIVNHEFDFSAESYFDNIFQIIMKNINNVADLTGSDLERAELDFLLYNLKLKLPEKCDIYVSDECYVKFWYDTNENRNKINVKFFIKELCQEN